MFDCTFARQLALAVGLWSWALNVYGCSSRTSAALPEVPAVDMAAACPKPLDAALLATGQRAYMRVCASCHQSDGRGLAGIFPPLAAHAARLGQNQAGRTYLTQLVLWGLSGPITIDGHVYQNVMPPQQSLLRDDEVAAVLSFVMHNFGNCQGFASMPRFDADEARRLRATTSSGLETFMLRKNTDFARGH